MAGSSKKGQLFVFVSLWVADCITGSPVMHLGLLLLFSLVLVYSSSSRSIRYHPAEVIAISVSSSIIAVVASFWVSTNLLILFADGISLWFILSNLGDIEASYTQGQLLGSSKESGEELEDAENSLKVNMVHISAVLCVDLLSIISFRSFREWYDHFVLLGVISVGSLVCIFASNSRSESKSRDLIDLDVDILDIQKATSDMLGKFQSAKKLLGKHFSSDSVQERALTFKTDQIGLFSTEERPTEVKGAIQEDLNLKSNIVDALEIILECRARLSTPELFVKHGRIGKPHARRVFLNVELRRFEWWTADQKKLVDSANVSDFLGVQKGRESPNFQKSDKGKSGITQRMSSRSKFLNRRLGSRSRSRGALSDSSDSNRSCSPRNLSGKAEENFKNNFNKDQGLDAVSFTMYFNHRTLDLEASNQDTRDQWHDDLQILKCNKDIFFL